MIDAQGGAAMFEVDGNSYKMFDANDPDVAPHGYVARTNFSNGGELNKGYGYVRFLEVDRVLSKACAMAALRAYAEAARQMGCTDEFVEDLECNVLPDFRDFQAQEPEKVKLPD